uniref:NADH-ubiquinone oxidoreductase chain 3 n=1 Tax=Amyrsidea minuta TaxID=2364307 RepID=A0A386B2C2_9NEOP|nr:NADH dehydrogenase subunit 3 [Amyrsidea minuta]
MNLKFIMFMTFFILMGFLSFIIFILSFFFIESYKLNESHDSAFECGFESLFLTRVPFSNQFFQITIVFLVFDLEVVIFLPFICYSWMDEHLLLTLSILLILLLVGLIIEWYDHSLEWSI